MQKYNIIFLDIDGVLNNAYSIVMPNLLLDPSTINNLKLILNMTNSKIVLSSAWRLYPKYKKRLIEELQKYKIPPSTIIGATHDLSLLKLSRDYEILLWVKNNKQQIKKWVSIDDLNLNKLPNENFVRTSFYSGLTKKLTGEVISKLIF